MKIRIFAAGAACAVLAAASTSALEPAHEISLRSGFMPDPLSLTVNAGGSVSASGLVNRTRGVGGARMGDAGDGHCRGSVSQAPTVRLEYSTRGNLPLIITHRADFDTTLVVRGPDGTWFCDDDSGEGLDAQLVLESPRSGAYDIWAGVFGRNHRGHESTLSLSEMRGQIVTGATGAASRPGASGSSTAGSGRDTASTQTVQLTEGFVPDPYLIEAEAGGSRTARRLSGSDVLARTGQGAQRCLTGHVTSAPTVRLEYETSGFFPLFLTLSPVDDLNTALLVRAPDGALSCAQGTSEAPGARIVFDEPASGAYEIWFGTRALSRSGQALLAISEIGAASDEDGIGEDGGAGSGAGEGGFLDFLGEMFDQPEPSGGAPALDASLPARGGTISASFDDLAARAHTINTRISVTHRLGFELGSQTLGEAGDRRCRGHSGQAPDLTAAISGRAQGDLVFTAEGDFDTTLAVLAPDGTWYCDDDSGLGTQAELAISDPQPGAYAVWLGAFIRSRDGADGAVQVSVR